MQHAYAIQRHHDDDGLWAEVPELGALATGADLAELAVDLAHSVAVQLASDAPDDAPLPEVVVDLDAGVARSDAGVPLAVADPAAAAALSTS